MSSNLISTPLDECQSWWASTMRAMRRLRYDWSVASQSTSFPLRHWNLRNLTFHPYNKNVTLQQECYLTNIPLDHSRFLPRLDSTFARLYNAAASPASRLRTAGSLAINRRNKAAFLNFSAVVWTGLTQRKGGRRTFRQIRAIAFNRYSLRQAGKICHVGKLCIHRRKEW